MIKIQVQNGKTFEGEVYAVDPVTKSIVLKVEENYVVINPSQVVKIDGDITALKAPPIAELGISIANIEKRELTALKQAEKGIAAINNSVDNDVQSLFDKLNTIYPCSWDKTTIIILDEYIIDAPYTEVKVKPGKDGSGIERVIKILEGERKKLKLDA